MWAYTAYLILEVPEKLQLYGLYVYCVVHICDFGMLRVKVGASGRETTLRLNVVDYIAN